MERKIHVGLAAAVLVAGCGASEGRSTDEPALAASRAQAATPSGRRSGGQPDERWKVVVLGTSLTAGLGVTPGDAYPALLQERIDRAGLPFEVVNAGVSGETSAGGRRRLDWLLRQDVAVLVVELGANDGLRGLPVDELEENLQAIIDRTKTEHPDAEIVIAGMQAPPNLGRRYTEAFRSVFTRVAERNGTTLIPFLLAGVAAVDELNQADGTHPNAQGHEIIAETVWNYVEPILQGLVDRETRGS